MILRMTRALFVVTAAAGALGAAGCGRSDPPPQAPSTHGSNTPVAVSGTEKIMWDQEANSAEQVARYRFIAIVDDVPANLTDASCDATPTSGRFPCSAHLPRMSAGPHRLQIAAEETGDRQRRSPRSGVLLLDVRPADTTTRK
jgi:hypothetical protein